MKHCMLMSVLSLLFSLLLPVTVQHAAGISGGEALPEVSPAASTAPESAADAFSGFDALTGVTLLRGGEVETLSMAEYLPGVVAGEMPASFEPDALRAQAAAARSYALARRSAPPAAHPQCALCDDPGCCEVYLTVEERRERWGGQYDLWETRIEEAVRDTDGAYLVYDGEPITACFHASSAGYTESGAAVWGGDVPYLVSVSSPETASDVPNFVTTAEFSPESFPGKISRGISGCRSLRPAAGLDRRADGRSERARFVRPCRGRLRTGDENALDLLAALGKLPSRVDGPQLSLYRFRQRPRRGHEPVWGERHGKKRLDVAGDLNALLPRHIAHDAVSAPLARTATCPVSSTTASASPPEESSPVSSASASGSSSCVCTVRRRGRAP